MVKKVKSKKSVWYKDKVFWVGAVALAVIVGGWYYHDSHSGKASREDFESAQTSLGKVYTDIVAKLGPPSNYKKTQSCSRPSQKFSQGPLSCSVSYDLIYKVESPRVAAVANSKIDTLISTSKLIPPKQLEPAYSDVDRGTELQIKYYRLSRTPLLCLVKKAFDNSIEMPREILLTPDQNYYIGVSCFGESRANYFNSD